MAISTIAGYDWPDSWPELIDKLVEALAVPNADLVNGALRFFHTIYIPIFNDMRQQVP